MPYANENNDWLISNTWVSTLKVYIEAEAFFSGLLYVTTRTEDSTGDLGSAIQRIWKWLPIFSDSLSPQLSKNNIALLEPKSP